MTKQELENQFRLIAIQAYKGNRVTQQLALEYALKEAFTVFLTYLETTKTIGRDEKDKEDGKENENAQNGKSPQGKRNVSPKGDDV